MLLTGNSLPLSKPSSRRLCVCQHYDEEMTPFKWQIKHLSNLDFSCSSRWILKRARHSSKSTGDSAGALTKILCSKLQGYVLACEFPGNTFCFPLKHLLPLLTWIMGRTLMFLLRFCLAEMPSKGWGFPLPWYILSTKIPISGVCCLLSRKAAEAERRPQDIRIKV